MTGFLAKYWQPLLALAILFGALAWLIPGAESLHAALTPLMLYLAAGALAGVLAGLFGIGGGLIIVPILVACMTWQKMPQVVIMHLALGTSLGSIVFTSVSSFMAHHQRGAVQWPLVKRITLGILAGTLAGTFIAARIPTGGLKVFFVVFVYYVAVQMLLDFKPKPSRVLPGLAGLTFTGMVIGVVSSLVGIGGGTLSVPFMLWCNIPLHTAIGTSAAIGFPIALAGTVGYIANGLSVPGLPPGCLGYLYLPALTGIVSASILTAPLGVRLAHYLPVAKLKRIFALLLLIVGTKMLLGVLS